MKSSSRSLLRFVDLDRGRGMPRENRHCAVADVLAPEMLVDVVGEIDELDRLKGSNIEQNVGDSNGLNGSECWL